MVMLGFHHALHRGNWNGVQHRRTMICPILTLQPECRLRGRCR